jgi:predicted nucleic acid-binding protein
VTACLDSWAVLAWLDGDEPAAGAVQEAFDAGRPWMSWLNLGEVAYQLERRHGADEAAVVIGRLRAAVALDDVTPDRVLAAAHIKAAHPIAFADCFAAATAAARAATLYTGDPELIEREVGCAVRDLRPPVTRG